MDLLPIFAIPVCIFIFFKIVQSHFDALSEINKNLEKIIKLTERK
jgi:hypothetical protein